MTFARLVRLLHRVHRSVGALMALVVALWCASGVVMIFVRFPRLGSEEALRRATPLVVAPTDQYPDELVRLTGGGFASGATLRLEMRENAASWLFDDSRGRAVARPAAPTTRAVRLDEARARAIANAFAGAAAVRAELVEAADQWTVGGVNSGEFPLWRVYLADDLHSEVYVAAHSKSVVQHTTRRARIYAWLGAIPHWIYPSQLRRERGLWRTTVLTLAGLGLLASVSGLVVGLRVWRKRFGEPVREPYLRAHHWLGLSVGGLVCTWLFSGALSLAPFGWTGLGASAEGVSEALHAGPATYPPLPALPELLRRCRGFDRGLRLQTFAGALYAVCSDQHGDTRAFDLAAPDTGAFEAIPLSRFRALADSLTVAGSSASVELANEPDDYYYRSHNDARFVLPFVRIALHDADDRTLYLDPRDGELLALYTRRTRLERWLYHGLHSFDFPWLYARRWLWYPGMISALLGGCTLASLGAWMGLRRSLRRVRARRRKRRVR